MKSLEDVLRERIDQLEALLNPSPNDLHVLENLRLELNGPDYDPDEPYDWDED